MIESLNTLACTELMEISMKRSKSKQPNEEMDKPHTLLNKPLKGLSGDKIKSKKVIGN